MIVKAPSVQSNLQPAGPANLQLNGSQQNHRQSPAVRALRWFWRFSQFYGEYAVRSPQERQQWLAEQTKHQ
ncbi:MAG: hypothetical protein WA885_01420 [Phormidesmis sp.]